MWVLNILGLLVLLAVVGLFCGDSGDAQAPQNEGHFHRNDELWVEEMSADQNDHFWDHPDGDNL